MLSPSFWIPIHLSHDLCLASSLATSTHMSELNKKHLGDLLTLVAFSTLHIVLGTPRSSINQHCIPLSNLLVAAATS
jgi:hypothetical protein